MKVCKSPGYIFAFLLPIQLKGTFTYTLTPNDWSAFTGMTKTGKIPKGYTDDLRRTEIYKVLKNNQANNIKYQYNPVGLSIGGKI